MAYIIVTADDGKVVSKRHHTDYPRYDARQVALFLNEIARAVLNAEAYTARQKRLENARSQT